MSTAYYPNSTTYWPQEALESDPLKLPTLRILRHASNIPGLDYDRMPPLNQDNIVTTSIREASSAVDNARHAKRTALHGHIGTKEHDKIVRQQCKPIQYHKKQLKHLAPYVSSGYTIGTNTS